MLRCTHMCSLVTELLNPNAALYRHLNESRHGSMTTISGQGDMLVKWLNGESEASEYENNTKLDKWRNEL